MAGPWPPILGLHKSLIVALTYMRRNRVQAELAETYEASQPAISRAVSGITLLLARVLAATESVGRFPREHIPA